MDPSLLLKSSGINSSFHGGIISFQDYIQHAQNVIKTARIDLTEKSVNKIVNANSPFEWRPENKTNKGILLIHGLFDSPYSLRDIGEFFLAKGFLVRSILLPGHGTRPGDLLYVDHQEWIKAVQFGVNELAKEVKEIYLCGYSLGGALSLNFTLTHPDLLKAIFLIAPAIESKVAFTNILIHLHQMTSLFSTARKWYKLKPQNSYVRYESFPLNAAKQAYQIVKINRILTAKHKLHLPICMILTENDEATHTGVALHFFKNLEHEKNRALVYSNKINAVKDERITIQKSSYPEKKILNFSHTSLTNSPRNIHYGEKGEFKDFQHYPYQIPQANEIYLGAIDRDNLKKYVVQRLSYNPDFSGMLKFMENFLGEIEESKHDGM